jgi:DNA-binding CsgD family transcriptional regulator
MKSSIYPFESILNAPSLPLLTQAVARFAGDAGFSSFHYGAHAPLKADGDKARFLFDGTEQKSTHVLSGHSDAWFSRYQTENYIDVDPLVKHCSKSILPMIWHHLPATDEPRVRQLFCDARQHGLAGGVTLSVLGKHQELGLLSLATDKDREKDRVNIVKHLGLGYMLMIHTHEAMRRLQFSHTAGVTERKLTQRECETLLWVSNGKTSWEIAHILRISERTVNFHIMNACSKLDAGTRRHAAAKALALGLICP